MVKTSELFFNDIKNLLLIQQQQLLEQQKQLGEQHKQLVEIVPKIGNITNNTAHIKQNFNINVFLNEQCKNAINMNDFVKQIKLTLEDLDLTKTCFESPFFNNPCPS